MKYYKLLQLTFLFVALMFCYACRTNHMLKADPNASDLNSQEISILNVKKMHVPCRIEVHCADSLVGERSSIFSFLSSHYYYYPLQELVRNGFKSATYSVFDQPGGEVIDAFTLYITVPESTLNVSGDEAEYRIHIIVTFNEPGEKKVTAWSIQKHMVLPYEDDDVVPESIYHSIQGIAYETLEKMVKNPKVLRTVKRFEDR